MFSHKIVVHKRPTVKLIQNNNNYRIGGVFKKYLSDSALLEDLPNLAFQPGDFCVYGGVNVPFTADKPCHVVAILEHQTDASDLAYNHKGTPKYYLCVGLSHMPNPSSWYIRYDDLVGYRKLDGDELKAVKAHAVVQDNLKQAKALIINERNN